MDVLLSTGEQSGDILEREVTEHLQALSGRTLDIAAVGGRRTLAHGVRGLVGACLLGLGRAVGETMAVTFVIGNDHRLSASLFAAGNSIASTLANEFAEASEPLYLSALVELGLVLFVLTFALQALTHLWIGRLERRSGQGL